MTAHAQCPKCRTPGAYVGFVKVECANPRCEDYVPGVASSTPAIPALGAMQYNEDTGEWVWTFPLHGP